MSRPFAERTLDESAFTTGSIVLTPGDANSLGLPAHSTTVALSHQGEVVHVSWQSARRTLAGEALLELLELNARIDGLARIHPPDTEGQPFLVQFLDRPAHRTGYRGLIEPVPPKPGRRAAGTQRNQARPVIARTSVDRNRIRDRKEFEWHGPVGISSASVDALRTNLKGGGWDPLDVFELRVGGEQLAAVTGFEELLALDLATVDHMPHQEATALKVLSHLRGRAILADEVGLGKTIEAGLILKELMVRGMAKKVLIICPATLREQWHEELRDKFHEDFEVVFKGTDPLDGDLLVMSHHMATRQVDRIADRRWDLLIVDEAHRMAGPGARRSRELLQKLDTRFALFLTATPVQNDLLELYRLVDALRPGTFVSQRDFKQRFMGANPREPSDPQALRRLIADVMVRTTRAQAGLDDVDRIPVDYAVKLSAPERRAYDLCLTTLRRHLNGPGDHLRRRQLAHRLTTSPRSLARTARKVAQSHADPEVCRVLDELADLCGEFGVTSRQKKLLELVQNWVADPEKGRVLVFTQHTDTLEDLIRVLDLEGIKAVPYHGGMSPQAKRASLDRFAASKQRGVPVMVSTDAGAEGLNLQFANCVVNYDLPWNPMRIEQRIGRVHRVTQKRNVYVANLFAKDTIDESVYRLLHDKLRMFELLFGQVTTILGELEGSETEGTFENRVMDAMLAKDDAAMDRRIQALGETVEKAFERVEEQKTESSHLNTWMFDTSHRKGLTKGGSSELTPSVVRRDRQRRADVEAFVRQYLEVVGGEVTWEVAGTKSKPGFISAKVPPEAAALLGQRDELHLAFGGEAMDHHAEAELCAVGTEIFEDLVGTLATRGDLVAEVPDERWAESDVAWFPGTKGLQFVERSFGNPTGWSSELVWRVRNMAEQSGDDLLTTFSGDKPETTWHRALGDGEKLPTTRPTKLVDDAVRAAIPQIAEVAASAQIKIDELAKSEHQRLGDYYEQRLDELRAEQDRTYQQAKVAELGDQIERLERAEAQAVRAVSITAEVQSDLLAVRLMASTETVVNEEWRSPTGEAFTISYLWDVSTERPESFEGDDGLPVTRVARCRDLHVVDASRTRTCPGCDLESCGGCEVGTEFDACMACGTALCGTCLTASLCQGCRKPSIVGGSPAPVRIDLGHGAVALLEEHRTTVSRPSGEVIEILSATGRTAATMPAFAQLVDQLGAQVGVRRADDGQVLTPEDEVVLSSQTALEISVDPTGGPALSPEGLRLLGISRDGAGRLETVHELDGWATKLRAEAALPPGPCLDVGYACVTRTLALQEGELILRSRTRHGDGSSETFDRPFEIINRDSTWSLCADDVDLSVRRAHRSFLVAVGEGVLITPGPEVDGCAELSLDQVAAANGRVGALVGLAAPKGAPDFADPEGDVSLIERTVKEVAVLSGEPRATLLDRVPGEAASVVPPVVELEISGADSTWVALDDLLPRPSELVLDIGHWVHETWRSSAGETQRERLVSPGESALPLLDDTGLAASEFSVDALGHLHEPNHHWSCGSCGDRRCRACGDDGVIAACPTCDQPACGVCRGGDEAVGQVLGRCAVCETAACSDCGHQVELAEHHGVTLCGACAKPARRPGSTDDGVIRLDAGHGSTIEVSLHRIRIERPSGEMTEVLTPSLRSALQLAHYERIADILGHDIGIEAGEDFGIALPDGERHISTTTRLRWRTSGGSGPIDANVGWLLPQVQGELRLEPTDELLDPWAWDLRSRLVLALQAPPTFEADRLDTVTSFVVEAGRPIVRTRNLSDDLDEETLDLEPELVVDTAGAHLEAQGFRASIERRNRSFALLTDANDPPFLLVPHLDGLCQEVDASDLAAASGRAGALVGVAESAPAMLLAEPGGDVVLADRSVQATWLASTAQIDRVAPAELLDDLLDERVSAAAAGHRFRVVTGDPAWMERLDEVLASVPDLVFERWHEVRETWESPVGRSTRERLVGPGSTGWPILDDTGQPAPEFSVDSFGHLHEPSRAWECPACLSRRCRGCGPEGELAPCLVCSQDACGTCRPTTVGTAVVTSRCVVCAAGNCTGCRHEVELSSCALCHRLVCADCWSNDLCRTCASLEPLDAAECLELPKELVARGGVTVLASADRDAMVLLMHTRSRRELAVLDGQRIRSWVTASDVDRSALQLILGLGFELQGFGGLSIDLLDSPPAAADPAALVLSEHELGVVLLQIFDEDGTAAVPAEDLGACADTSPSALVEHALRARGLPAASAPQPADADQAQRLRELVPIGRDRGATPVVALRRSHRLDTVRLVAGGLEVHTGYTHCPEKTVIPWEQPSSAASAAWDGRLGGELLSIASGHGHTAALLAAGPFPLVALDQGGAVQVLRLDDQQNYPAMVGVSAWLGTGHDRIGLRGFVTPTDEPGVQVMSGMLAERTWHPVVAPAPAFASPLPGALARVLAACPVPPPPAIGPVIPAGELPAALRRALADLVDAETNAADAIVQVGYRCEERWSLPSGDVSVSYGRAPADLRPVIDDAPAPVAGPTVHVDRSGHLADVVTACPYCGTDTCPACTDGLASCETCGQAICGRCAPGGLHQCLACAGLSKVSMLGRRRLEGRPKAAVEGHDDLHHVLIVPSPDGRIVVQVTNHAGLDHITAKVAPAAVLAHLNSLARTSAYGERQA